MSDLNVFRKTVLSAKSEAKQEFQANEPEKETERKRIEPNNTRIDIEKPKFCIHCGFPLEEGNDFCTECGAKIEKTEETEKETDSVEKIAEKKSTQQPLKISADRMASIKENRLLKDGIAKDAFRERKKDLLRQKEEIENQKKELKKQETELLSGNYVYKDSKLSITFLIETISGSKILASARFIFSEGGYCIEHFSGSIAGDNIELKLIKDELHPSAGTHIQKSTRFSGFFSGDRIIGTFEGEYNPISVVLSKTSDV